MDADLPLVPFLCEYADPGCNEVIRLPLDEYERIRSEPAQFLNAPGHEANALGYERVVDRHEDYVVAVKTGVAGTVAAELDPRGANG